MARSRLWLAAYDVADPTRLRHTAKTLERYGARLQKSVFECGLSREEHQAMRWHLENLLRPEEGDKLLLHPVCNRCRRGIRWMGKAPAAEAEPFWIV